MEIREFSRNDRVKVNNVYGWDISFYSDVARRDIMIPGGAKGYALITLDMAEEAIEKPSEATIFHLAAVSEARAYKAGFRDCLDMIKELFNK